MIERRCKENLLTLARTYASATKQPLRKVSTRFYGNTVFFRDFARGRKTISLSRYDEALKQFLKEWPEGVAWPKLEPIDFPVLKR
jgi:hypothetical protein